MQNLVKFENIIENSKLLLADTLKINSTNHIVEVRQKGREIAQYFMFSKLDQTRFATALSEISRNVVTYAGNGQCEFKVFYDNIKALFPHVILSH